MRVSEIAQDRRVCKAETLFLSFFRIGESARRYQLFFKVSDSVVVSFIRVLCTCLDFVTHFVCVYPNWWEVGKSFFPLGGDLAVGGTDDVSSS